MAVTPEMRNIGEGGWSINLDSRTKQIFSQSESVRLTTNLPPMYESTTLHQREKKKVMKREEGGWKGGSGRQGEY